MGKMKNKLTEEQKRAFIVAQDKDIVLLLSGNDEKRRDKTLKSLKSWLLNRSKRMPLQDDDLKRIWKGLYYAMWSTADLLPQENCAETISQLVHLSSAQESLNFFKYGLLVLSIEWFGIGMYFKNKFKMLVRRLLRQGFQILKNYNWNKTVVQSFGTVLLETVLTDRKNEFLELTLHLISIYLEELAKISNGKIDSNIVTELIKPIVKYLSSSGDSRVIKCISKFIFDYLFEQSDEGLKYEAKFKVWKAHGFMGGTIDALEEVDQDISSESEDMDVQEDGPLDPRAGRVNVSLSQLKFDPSEILTLLKNHKKCPGSKASTRKAILKLINKFQKFNSRIYPGMCEVPTVSNDGYSMKLKNSVNRLNKFQESITKKGANKSTENSVRDITKDIKTKQKNKRILNQVIQKNKNQNLLVTKNVGTCGTWIIEYLDNSFPNDSFQSTPSKKVKINLDLNRTQRFCDHRRALKISPGIPFNASKIPRKSSLKNNLGSRINPFYRA